MSAPRIAIDARMTPTSPGGVLQVVIGMAHGLSQLTDGNEEYTFLVDSSYDGWLDVYLGDNCQLLQVGFTSSVTLRSAAARMGFAKPAVPKSDGTVERQGYDGIHFLLPMGFRTRVPSFYQIHDLQHLHFPENFSRRTRLLRDAMYAAMCGQATRVFTMTAWGKQDAVDRLRLEPEKIDVVPWGSVLSAYREPSSEKLDQVCNKYRLNGPFALFPAKAYAHKNHGRLLKAIARLRDQEQLRVPLVLCGAPGAATASIDRTIARLCLKDQVRHLGFVGSDDITALFHRCHCVVFPSLFEGWGLPITEALSLKRPIACANAACLPEVAGDAAAYFDPLNVKSMAYQIRQVWTNAELRKRLAQNARGVVRNLTWKNTAQQFRTHYRDIFGGNSARHTVAA
ncbi:MAG: glycosyltransferase family 1 protein [Pirellulales bacterium]